MAATPDLGSGVERREGSSPSWSTLNTGLVYASSTSVAQPRERLVQAPQPVLLVY